MGGDPSVSLHVVLASSVELFSGWNRRETALRKLLFLRLTAVFGSEESRLFVDIPPEAVRDGLAGALDMFRPGGRTARRVLRDPKTRPRGGWRLRQIARDLAPLRHAVGDRGRRGREGRIAVLIRLVRECGK